MGKRLFALVVALAVVSGPASLAVCQMTCASTAMLSSMLHAERRAGHDQMPAHHASCHEHGGAPRLSPGNVPCDHGIQGTPSLVAARDSADSVSSLAVVPLRQSNARSEARGFVSVQESTWSDRLAIPLAVPLRV
jgi:hypothetical protein